MCKCVVSIAAHKGFKNEGVPTKLQKSRLLRILDYYTWYQIKAKTYAFKPLSQR